MAWPGGGKINFEETFGMKEDEFKNHLKASSEAKAMAEETKTAVSGLQTMLSEIQNGLKSLQENPTRGANTNGNPNGNPNQNQNGNQNIPAEPQFTSFMDDENKAFVERAQTFVKPLVDQTLELRAEIAYSNFKSRNDDFILFEDEIKTELAKAPLNLRGNPEYLQNAYNMVKGRHTDEISEHRAKRQGKYFMESARSNQNTIPGDKPPGNGLSNEELVQAEKFGITPEQYAESRGKMRFV